MQEESEAHMPRSKTELRAWLKNINVSDKVNKDYAIYKNLVELEAFKKASGLFAFMPASSEPDVLPIIELAWLNGKRVAVPVTHDKLPEMHFEEVLPGDKYALGSVGMSEPTIHRVTEFIPDIILVPMVACDKAKNRMGRGKGYYDRFLRYGTTATKIGVVYSDRKVPTVFPDELDVPMDIIVTDEEVII